MDTSDEPHSPLSQVDQMPKEGERQVNAAAPSGKSRAITEKGQAGILLQDSIILQKIHSHTGKRGTLLAENRRV